MPYYDRSGSEQYCISVYGSAIGCRGIQCPEKVARFHQFDGQPFSDPNLRMRQSFGNLVSAKGSRWDNCCCKIKERIRNHEILWHSLPL